MSDVTRKLIGIEALNAAAAPAPGVGTGTGAGGERWTGAGEVVAVVDSGIDRDHPDLSDRVRHVAAGCAGGMDKDVDGHGTHVAGTAVGDGTASGGRVRGMAPGAGLVVIGITDDAGRPQLPADLGDLLHQAADPAHGAKVVNVSWDAPLAGTYDHGARAVDAFVRERPDVLVVVAAGNEGSLGEDGFPYIRSLGTPATAKNVVTVGACSSARTGFTDTWGTYRPDRFDRPPMGSWLVAGDPTCIAPLSSRGPTDFDSIKPDVVAPGTAILAPRASITRPGRMWREWPEHDGRYGLMIGTSSAAPVVSGAAAVLRQVLREAPGARHPDPSAALLKAVLVAATTRLPYHRPEADVLRFGYPDFDQGFGRLDLTQVLPLETPEGRRLWCDDVPSDGPGALESRPPVGARHTAARRYRFEIGGPGDTGDAGGGGEPQPLRVVVAWTDVNEAAIQNCLSVELQGPGGVRARGNAEHRWGAGDERLMDPKARSARIDRHNNVQAIGLPEAPPGRYTLTVFASNTLFPPQGYGLCICGHLAGDPTVT